MHVHCDCLGHVNVACDQPLELSVWCEHLNSVVVLVGNYDVCAAVNAHAPRLSELPLECSILAEAAYEVTVTVKHHHAVVMVIGDVAASVLVHGDVDWPQERKRGVRSELAEAASVFHVVHRDTPGRLVHHDHARSLEVVLDPHRLAEHLAMLNMSYEHIAVMFNLTGLNYFRHFPTSLP